MPAHKVSHLAPLHRAAVLISPRRSASPFLQSGWCSELDANGLRSSCLNLGGQCPRVRLSLGGQRGRVRARLHVRRRTIVVIHHTLRRAPQVLKKATNEALRLDPTVDGMLLPHSSYHAPRGLQSTTIHVTGSQTQGMAMAPDVLTGCCPVHAPVSSHDLLSPQSC